jgi:hypothetical protein
MSQPGSQDYMNGASTSYSRGGRPGLLRIA